MKKGKIFAFVLLLGVFILSTEAFALPVGQHVGFYDFEIPGTPVNWTWTHTLDNNEFIPHLEDNEPLIIKHALLLLSLNFTPDMNSKGKYVFNASVNLDDSLLGNINYSSWSEHWVYNLIWGTSITDPVILEKIADKSATITIASNIGTLNYVQHSVLLGSGVVGPEPISMALVGAGLAGLPIAVRFRRLLRK
jgi:hypothetical protein